MSGLHSFPWVTLEEAADLDRVRGVIEWHEFFLAHLSYLDNLIAVIRALDTAQIEQRIRRSMRVLERRRANGMG
jgi:hypothetical protein